MTLCSDMLKLLVLGARGAGLLLSVTACGSPADAQSQFTLVQRFQLAVHSSQTFIPANFALNSNTQKMYFVDDLGAVMVGDLATKNATVLAPPGTANTHLDSAPVAVNATT